MLLLVGFLSRQASLFFIKQADKINSTNFLPNILKVNHLDGKDFRPTTYVVNNRSTFFLSFWKNLPKPGFFV